MLHAQQCNPKAEWREGYVGPMQIVCHIVTPSISGGQASPDGQVSWTEFQKRVCLALLYLPCIMCTASVDLTYSSRPMCSRIQRCSGTATASHLCNSRSLNVRSTHTFTAQSQSQTISSENGPTVLSATPTSCLSLCKTALAKLPAGAVPGCSCTGTRTRVQQPQFPVLVINFKQGLTALLFELAGKHGTEIGHQASRPGERLLSKPPT